MTPIARSPSENGLQCKAFSGPCIGVFSSIPIESSCNDELVGRQREEVRFE